MNYAGKKKKETETDFLNEIPTQVNKIISFHAVVWHRGLGGAGLQSEIPVILFYTHIPLLRITPQIIRPTKVPRQKLKQLFVYSAML